MVKILHQSNFTNILVLEKRWVYQIGKCNKSQTAFKHDFQGVYIT